MAARAWHDGTLFGAPARAAGTAMPANGMSGDDALSDALAMGLSADEIARLEQQLARSSGAFDGVWPDHVTAVAAFVAAATQWRTALAALADGIASRFLGLDYAGASVAWNAFGITIGAEDMGRLRTLENAAATLLNGGAVK